MKESGISAAEADHSFFRLIKDMGYYVMPKEDFTGYYIVREEKISLNVDEFKALVRASKASIRGLIQEAFKTK